MASARARRRERTVDYWPGFVDALSTLILAVIFMLSIFMVVQYFLSQEVSGKDAALTRLNAQLAQLTEILALEKGSKASLEEQLASLSASLSAARNEADRLRGQAANAGSGQAQLQGQIGALNQQIDEEKRLSARALSQVEILNQQIAALRRQLAALEEALNASEGRDRESQARIADLGQRLNVALAQRVQELSRYRSEFFGRLREIIGNRPDIRIVGDRFVFQSEVFFDPGQAVLRGEGRAQLDRLAAALVDIEKQIPPGLNWVLRVDGHTDARPINSPQFPSNWELSSARAISVVQYLIARGISPQRLVAAGFGEFQPIDTAGTDEALARNRRIELKLTER
jgi:chemotaxis protein MotB